MQPRSFRSAVHALAALLVLAAAASAASIQFSGQLAPGVAVVSLNGGDGSFDGSGAPNSVTLVGSDSGNNNLGTTTVEWSITQAIADLSFDWFYESFDLDGPQFDPAGYFINAAFVQLSDSAGPVGGSQNGSVTGLNLAVGDTFGFFVNGDQEGRARITISGRPNTVVPEPGTFALFGFGAAALLAVRRRRG